MAALQWFMLSLLTAVPMRTDLDHPLLPQDPKISAVKDHNSLIIRAETMEQKMQWLSRMRKAAEGPRRPPPAPGTLKVGGEGGRVACTQQPGQGTSKDRSAIVQFGLQKKYHLTSGGYVKL
jgi:hypothetical protein